MSLLLAVQGGEDQPLAASRFDNSNTFYASTVSAGAVTLAPSRFDNNSVFYSAAISFDVEVPSEPKGASGGGGGGGGGGGNDVGDGIAMQHARNNEIIMGIINALIMSEILEY